MPEISFCLFDLGYLFKLFPKTDNEFTVSLSATGNTEAISEAQAVLLSLGYSAQEAKGAIKLACQTVTKQDSAEEILKEALHYLAQE